MPSNKDEVDKNGNYVRKDSSFRETISKDHSIYKPEGGNRYHLYVCLGCPFAHRTLIMRELKGLEEVIGVSIVDYELDKSVGWSFRVRDGSTGDKINHFEYLKQVYQLSDKDYNSKITVPVLFDTKTKTIVNNESSEIIRIFNSGFNDFCKTKEQSQLDFYPIEKRKEIDEINTRVYDTLNNGVYKCGFAETQSAYDSNYSKLFETLDYLDSHLSRNRYLVGRQLTEADIRLFVTLIRFDAVYYSHFKVNRNQIKDFPNLSNYLKELYQINQFKKTVDFHHIKNCYYKSMSNLNPYKIVPNGPDLSYLEESHNRNSIN